MSGRRIDKVGKQKKMRNERQSNEKLDQVQEKRKCGIESKILLKGRTDRRGKRSGQNGSAIDLRHHRRAIYTWL